MVFREVQRAQYRIGDNTPMGDNVVTGSVDDLSVGRLPTVDDDPEGLEGYPSCTQHEARATHPRPLAEHMRQLQELLSGRLLAKRPTDSGRPVTRSIAPDVAPSPAIGALAAASTRDQVRTWLPLLNLATGGRCLFVGGQQETREGAALFFAWLAGRSRAELRRPRLRGKLATGLRECLHGPLADVAALRRPEQARFDRIDRWEGPRGQKAAKALLLPRLALGEAATRMSTSVPEPSEFEEVFALQGGTPWFIAAGDDSRRSTGRLLEAFHDRIDLVVDVRAFEPNFLAEFASAIDRKAPLDPACSNQMCFVSEELEAMQRQAASIHVPGELRRALGLFADWLDGALAATPGACQERTGVRSDDHGGMQLTPSETPSEMAGSAVAEAVVPASVWSRVLHLAMALAWLNGRDQVTPNELRLVLALTMPGMLTLVSRRRGGIGLIDLTMPAALEPWIDAAFERALAAYEAVWGGGRRDLWLELQAEAEVGEVAQHSRIVRHRLREVKAVIQEIRGNTTHIEELRGELRRLCALELSLTSRFAALA